jgi:hypothetical protein
MKQSLRHTRTVLSLAAVAALAPGAAVAQAAPAKVTGGQTTVTLSAGATDALKTAGVVVAPLAPATAVADGLSFPVVRGHVNTTAGRGVVRHRGGLSLTKGQRTVRLRRPVIRVTRAGAFLTVRVKHRACQLRKVVRRAVRAHQHGRRHVGRTVVRYVRHHCVGRHGARIRAFTLSGLQRSDQGGNIVVTANLALTQRAAALLNRAFGTSFAAGAAAGTATATLTVAP